MYTTSSLLYFYGIFLILCGIVAVAFIGMKAKTALASGGTSGLIAIAIAYFMQDGNTSLALAGILVSAGLLCVFSWRSTKTLHTIFKLIPSQHPDLAGKG
ncbi:MAG TPA: TMEM14 family protein, partial [Chryseosolibacter sp.]